MNGMDAPIIPCWGGLRGVFVVPCNKGTGDGFVVSTTVHWLSENGTRDEESAVITTSPRIMEWKVPAA
jgi:hypothetical protein